MMDENVRHCLPLYKAALHGDWDTAKRIFDSDSNALTANISPIEETALHVSICAGHSIEFVEKLVDRMPADELGIKNKFGQTPLHAAGVAGNTEAAKVLVKKNPRLTQERNSVNDTPLHLAAVHARKETVQYLLSVTQDEDPSPFADKDGVKLLNLLITADFYSIALDLLKLYPALARRRDGQGVSALDRLAGKPQAFASGSRLGFFQRLFYHFACTSADKESVHQGKDVENPGGHFEEYQKESMHFQFLQHIQKKNLLHKQAMELLRLLISEAIEGSVLEADNLLASPTGIAATLGIQEFVTEVIKSYPYIVWLRNRDGQNIFLLAVKHRQEKIFNLLYQMGTHKLFTTTFIDKQRNSMLHLAGMLEPSKKISGAALQMQRELQWFKEVEKVVQPSYKEIKNKDGKIPREVFTEEHKDLVGKGEKWMKDTASSCATVAALVVTVVFAAAFTVPGGTNSEQGIPIYLKETSFMIFAVSDALGLFSSSTSLLMFLGILTSRYSEEDFLKALPMRLSIGLITLFFSIASMLVAFTAAFHLVLFHRVKWITIPIGLTACAPVTLFALLQFPLLVEIVSSTFGPSIFYIQSEEIIF
ncbi:protein ACCELERATED CELL DEATH 6 isoform X2 [Hevea brasiliensis]|uniref:protein ACCELERATED CELL DEATH 6 isoform X2 n=1 Tax=Hevea brasiliensis TaxID=3981 RepID=UPI002600C38E|nr:protein ACCELERATED CELL DEATH 6 isoform X2 [Hevea brasiliensis]